MLVYVADKKQFLHDCDYEDIEDVIQTKFKEVTGKRVAQAEVKSWQSSLSYLAKVLRDDEIRSGRDGTVSEQIVVWVIPDDPELVIGRDPQQVSGG